MYKFPEKRNTAMVMFDLRVREHVGSILKTLGHTLADLGISPNSITGIGL